MEGKIMKNSDNDSSDNSDFDSEEPNDINFDNLSDSVGKIHIGIILLTISLFFSNSQSQRNKNLKDEEIPLSDYITGLIYMCIMIFSLIRMFNSFMSLTKEYEIMKDKIPKKKFMLCN